MLAHPFVYNRVRPWVVGGVDMSPVYATLEARPDDVILDVGCGAGDALHYLSTFEAYHGFDVDPVAIEFARKEAAGRANVTYEARALGEQDLAAIRPSLVILAGLLHHMDDLQALELLRMFVVPGSIRRIVTQDVVYLPHKKVSNFLASLDRGKFVRREHGYRELAARAGLEVESARVVRSDPDSGRAFYFVMTLSTSSP